MTSVSVYNLQKEEVSQIDLSDDVFAVPVKKHVLHQTVIGQEAARRSGSASTKSRSEVNLVKGKLWRQKGTGRARVGTAASPTRRGGGVAFGPKPRDYDIKVPRKVKRSALRMALSDKLQSDQLIVVDRFDLPEMKTKKFVGVMGNFQVAKALIVTEGKLENLEKASRNVPWVKVMRHEGLNVFDILKYDHLLVERGAVEKIQEALSA